MITQMDVLGDLDKMEGTFSLRSINGLITFIIYLSICEGEEDARDKMVVK
jgi:hypothetical protein